MDALFAAIKQKKRDIESVKKSDQKWYKQSDHLELKRQKAEEDLKKNANIKKKCLEKKLDKIQGFYKVQESETPSEEWNGTKQNVSHEEVVFLLRKLKHPIILFGESSEERSDRLMRLQIEASREAKITTANAADKSLSLPVWLYKIKDGQPVQPQQRIGTSYQLHSDFLDPKYNYGEDCKDMDAESQHYQVLHWIVDMLDAWEDEIIEEIVKILKDGRESEAKRKWSTLTQTKIDIKPLVKLLKSQQIDSSILGRLCNIVEACKNGEYKKAHDDYMLLAIGNAAWPMGVTMVGIHERAGRSKIFTSEVAHILNDETTRKYIQMFKRLISFAQSRFATDASKVVKISTTHV